MRRRGQAGERAPRQASSPARIACARRSPMLSTAKPRPYGANLAGAFVPLTPGSKRSTALAVCGAETRPIACRELLQAYRATFHLDRQYIDLVGPLQSSMTLARLQNVASRFYKSLHMLQRVHESFNRPAPPWGSARRGTALPAGCRHFPRISIKPLYLVPKGNLDDDASFATAIVGGEVGPKKKNAPRRDRAPNIGAARDVLWCVECSCRPGSTGCVV